MVATAVEDYVKVIYAHTEWQHEKISTGTLAARLGLAASTVTEMVGKLVAQGLVEHQKYGAVELTAAGETLALRMVRRHRLIEAWLVRQYGYGWDEVHDEAEVLEHAVSDDFVARIDAHLGHPSRDPHGDPIPSADGEPHLPDATVLALAAADRPLRVRRISDEDPRLLRELAEHGIGLDATLVRAGASGDPHAVFVTVDGSAARPLTPAAASAVWVSAAD